jgi:hypothetical protein
VSKLTTVDGLAITEGGDENESHVMADVAARTTRRLRLEKNAIVYVFYLYRIFGGWVGAAAEAAALIL